MLTVVFQVAMGVAFLFLKKSYESGFRDGTARSAKGEIEKGMKWEPVILGETWQRAIAAFVFISMNIIAIEESARGSGYPPRWAWPVIIFGLCFVTSIYFVTLKAFVRWSKRGSLLQVKIVRLGDEPLEEHAEALNRAKLEDNSRIVVYKVSD
jgi:hypothetical protein